MTPATSGVCVYYCRTYQSINLLLFLQKQNLATAIYLFGLGTLLTGLGLKHMRICSHHDLVGALVTSLFLGRPWWSTTSPTCLPLSVFTITSDQHRCRIPPYKAVRGGGRRRVDDMCYDRRRAEACVDESAHHALGCHGKVSHALPYPEPLPPRRLAVPSRRAGLAGKAKRPAREQ
jgi:hypothetical protein